MHLKPCVAKILALKWCYSVYGICVNVYKTLAIFATMICILSAQKSRLIETSLLSLILFSFQRYKLYSGIIYYDGRSLLY